MKKILHFQKTISFTLIFTLIFQIGFLFIPQHVQAATNSWDFSSSSDYTFDNTKIEFSSGQAQLKAPSDWYNSSWSYRKQITVDRTMVSGSLTDYPLYVDLADDSDISSKSLPNGHDILFTDSTGITKLNSDLLEEQRQNLNLVDNGAWCWFQDPRVVYYDNNTYIGNVNSTGDIIITKADQITQTVSSYTLHVALQVDDHANPSILILPDHRLMVFYSAHNGSSIYYRISTNPEDISSWGVEQSVETNTTGLHGYSYPNVVQLSGEGNKIYLFWRGGDWEPTFSTTTDLTSWAPAKDLINVPGQRPYVKYVSNGTDEIAFTFGDAHPTDPEVTTDSIYFAYYKNGNFYKADGTLIGNMSSLPLATSSVDKVYDSVATGIKAWVWDIALNQSGNPVIVYATFPSTTDHRYRYAVWNGTVWVDNEITAAGRHIDGESEPYYSGGIALDHDNPSVVYLSRQVNGQFEIEKWTTENNGVSWASQSITSNSSVKNVRPVVPRGHAGDSPAVVWMAGQYTDYTNYNTSITSSPTLTTTTTTTITFGNSEAHVLTPSLSSSSNSSFYVYYGNQIAANQSTPSSVWDTNYKLVQHQNSNASGTIVYDSTTNMTDSSKKGISEPIEVTGKMSKAQSYDGIDDYLLTSSLNIAGWTQLTAEAWVKYEPDVTTHKYSILSNWNTTVGSIMIRIDPATNKLQAYVIAQLNTAVGGTFTDITLDSKWHHIAVTYDTTNGLKAYLDGNPSNVSFAASGAIDSDSSVNLKIGATAHNTVDQFKGKIDEVHISNTVRSSDVIKTEYNNQNSPLTFYSTGIEEPIYPTSTPTIQPVTYTPFTSLSGFSETATKNGGEIKYQISNDGGTTWYWYNSGWAITSAGYTETNTASDINSNIATFPTGSGEFLFRAYLNSNGTQLVQLDSVDLTYTNIISHTITSSAGSHGSISPSGATTVNSGENQTYNITADSGYHISDVLVDDSSVGVVSSYIFSNVVAGHTISATFAVTSSGGSGCYGCFVNPSVPSGGFKMNINGGVATTSNRNVILGFNARADIKKIAISMTGDFTDASQENYIAYKQWDLCSKLGGLVKNSTCPDGKYTVYAKFYTAYGRSSDTAVASSTITLKSGGGAENLQTNLSFSNPFTKYLQYRQTSPDIKRLQIFLNSNPDTKIADTGLGSPGKETNYFGLLTYKAVIKFQEKFAKDILTPWGFKNGTGYVGKTTLLKINELIGNK
jgi:hypothetical protein